MQQLVKPKKGCYVMTNETLRGKTDVRIPHVRFDEGEVAPAKPRRGSLLYLGNAYKRSISALALLGVAFGSSPAFAEHEWGACDGGYTNDLWTLTCTLKSKQLTLDAATPKVEGTTTLDLSNFPEFKQFNIWKEKYIASIKKLVVPDRTFSQFSIQEKGCTNLTEICTPDGGHVLSINSWNSGIARQTKLSGRYVITNITANAQKYAFAEAKSIESVKLCGSYSSLGDYTFYDCNALRSVELETTGNITAIPTHFCGSWGNNSGYGPIPVTSVTLNGMPLLRSRAITSVGADAFSHCAEYSDIVDLPNCTSVGESAFAYAESLSFVNLMSVTSLGKLAFANCPSLCRLVLGETSALKNGDQLFRGGTFGSATSPAVIWNSTNAPSTIVENMFWNVADYHLTNYVRKEARSAWDTALAKISSSQAINKQNYVSMDTAVKVHFRTNGVEALTTLMPGVDGALAENTFESVWFFPAEKTFGTCTVKDMNENVIEGASAALSNRRHTLAVSLPESMIVAVEGTTQDAEINVDLEIARSGLVVLFR